MKAFKGGVVVLFLIIFSMSVYASQTLISDSFDYADDYSNHGWTFASSEAEFPTAPTTSPFTSNAFYFDAKSSAGTTYTGGIYQNLDSYNITSGYGIYSFNLLVLNDSTRIGNFAFSSVIYVNGTSGVSGNARFHLRVIPLSNGVNFTVLGTSSNVTPCSQQLTTAKNISARFSALLDYDNWVYTIYMNDTALTNCANKTFNAGRSQYTIARLYQQIEVETNENLIVYADDFSFVWYGSESTLTQTGYPCQTNSDCASGKCEYGACVLKQSGDSCTSSSQCASGDCFNGLCTKPTLSQNLDLVMSENFGSDTKTKNMVSLFLMIGVPAMLVIMGGGNPLLILLAIGVFFVEGFAFTYMGWLSPFILIGVILFALIVVVFAFMVKANG